MIRAALLVSAALLLAACSGIPREPVPVALQEAAVVPGMPDVRYWADVAPANLDELLASLVEQREASGLGNDSVTLALSGGADNGAFGAGLLNAWTKLGTRPEFTMVTGVSTGALSAPFAFLGPDYDDALRAVYGGFPREQIFRLRDIFSILPRASVADTAPLVELIARFADKKMLAAIAHEHRRGRRLIVQTANLDAQRAMLWDLGAIADSGAPNALEMFRKILLASASIPVAFPPVLFEVEAGGRKYDELHVDGSVISVATVLSDWQVDLADVVRRKQTRAGSSTIYVIRNGRVAPEPEPVDHRLLPIAARSIGTLLKMQGVSDLLTTYVAGQVRGASYNVTWIGEEFQHEYPGPFDPEYMAALYQYGYDLMMSGNAWASKPPILMSGAEREALLRRLGPPPAPAPQG
jgi:hypothetical protein